MNAPEAFLTHGLRRSLGDPEPPRRGRARRPACAPAASVASPWLTADEAAAYMRCPVSRIRKLTMTRDLPSHRDGRRALYHREELDAFIRNGGAICP